MSPRILVIGESCLDEFLYCKVDRLCPEGPVPVLETIESVTNKGMAGNCHANIESLGLPCALITNSNSDKVRKTRLVEKKHNHMFLRLDNVEPIPRISGLEQISFESYEITVISDYDKGYLTEEDINYIGRASNLTFMDTKKILGGYCDSIDFIKINHSEYMASKPFLTPDLEGKIIETLGGDGARYGDNKYPVENAEVKDLSGAGDSFMAGLVVKYLETKDIDEAIRFANECATIVVGKAGVSLIND